VEKIMGKSTRKKKEMVAVNRWGGREMEEKEVIISGKDAAAKNKK
jgi:hypothetical protein